MQDISLQRYPSTSSTSATFPRGYFYIKCKKNGMVLDVEGASKAVNARLIVWPQKREPEDISNQLWFYEEGFLYNKNSHMTLDVKDGKVGPETPIIQYSKKVTKEASNQLWGYDNGFIYLLDNPEFVLDVKHASDQQGAKVILWKRKKYEFENQLWDLESRGTSGASFNMGETGESYTYRGASGDDVVPTIVPQPEDLEGAHRIVYAGEKRGIELTHELISAAAAYEAVNIWEEKQQSRGTTVVHQVAKTEISDIATAEVEKLANEYDFEGDIKQAKAAAVLAAVEQYDRQLKPMYSSYYI